MKTPPPRRSQFIPASLVRGGPTDYNMKDPLNADGSNFPCKGYPPGPAVATYKAGDTIKVEIDGSAIHGGGHCQFSISYNDKDFVAIKTIIRTCFLDGKTFNVQIPPETPSCDRCTFSWTWNNAVGNREQYMNCADIKITGGGRGSLTGKRMAVANLPGYPQIAEWPPATNDGREVFEQAPTISISNQGTSSSGAGDAVSLEGDTGSSPVNQTKPIEAPVQPSQPDPAPSKAPAQKSSDTTSTPPGSGADDKSACTNGAMRCTQGGQGWQQCSNGVWMNMQVAPGTKCKDNNGSILLDYA